MRRGDVLGDRFVLDELAGSGGMGHDDRALQCCEVLLTDPRVSECAEARVDAIDGVRSCEGRCHYVAACPHALRYVRAELDVGAVERDIHNVLDGERLAADDHCSHG